MFVNQFSGLFTFLSYASAVFIESGSNFSPNVSALIAGVLLVSGSIFSVLIIDKISRRLFYSLTTIVNIVGLVSMGIYNFLKIHQVSLVENFKFVPVVSLSLVIFVAALGRLPLTYVMMAEIMPQNIRSFGISTANTCNWVFVFILLKSFSLAVEIFQFYMCMFAFSGVLLFGMIFVIFYVPETKKRSFEEIESSLVVKQLKSKKPKTTESRELEKL